MLTIRKTARFFDRIPAKHPDTGRTLFKCQMSIYDGSKRDSFAAFRRVMSADVDKKIPEEGAISIQGFTWLVGEPNFDSMYEVHRASYVVHQASGKAEIFSLAQFLEGKTDNKEWSDAQYVAARKEENYSSEHPVQYALHFRAKASIPKHAVITLSGNTYLTQFQHRADAGFLIVEGFEQSFSAPTKVTVNARKFNPVKGKPEDVTPVEVMGMVVRWQEFFRYTEQVDERYQEGDRTLVLPPGTTINTGSTVRAGRLWDVIDVDAMEGVQVVHVRPQ